MYMAYFFQIEALFSLKNAWFFGYPNKENLIQKERALAKFCFLHIV